MVSFYILFLAQCVGSATAFDLNSIKDNLNKILHTNRDIHIITLTRNLGSPTKCSYPGFGLFSTQQLELLNQKLSKESGEEGQNEHIDKKLKKQLLLPPNELKIVIFNEYFFKKIAPLTNKEFRDILTKIIDLSKTPAHHNSIFYVNFLHQEEIESRGPTPEQAEIITRNRKNYAYHNKSLVNYDNTIGFPNAIPKDVLGILRNETLVINNGSILARYKKRSYCNENNPSILNNYVYDFGDGYDKGSDIVNHIRTKICFDLFNGLRQINQWNNSDFCQCTDSPIPSMSNSSLHIIQSNYITIHQSINNLPKNKLIVHVDPVEGCGRLFYISKGTLQNYGPKSKATLQISNSNTLQPSVNNGNNDKIVVMKIFTF